MALDTIYGIDRQNEKMVKNLVNGGINPISRGLPYVQIGEYFFDVRIPYEVMGLVYRHLSQDHVPEIDRSPDVLNQLRKQVVCDLNQIVADFYYAKDRKVDEMPPLAIAEWLEKVASGYESYLYPYLLLKA